MRKMISANDCSKMFDDRFDNLTMKELGIELKHFSMGTAPETPSFLVNQEQLKQKIIEKFSAFFDENRAQGLEIIFLKSNYGNGKSHFIRMIYSFFEQYENIIAKKVSLKQEKTDLKRKVLESITQRVLRECAVFFVNSVREEIMSDDKTSIIFALEEKYSIKSNLAQILYEAARGADTILQIQAVSILKGNYLPEYLKSFSLKKADLDGEFYYDVIQLIAIYLKKTKEYLVIVFDEYEHVFSWKNKTDRKNLFEDIKLFTDNIELFGNMFFVFAESDSADSRLESLDDPAFKSRKANLTCQIADISSQEEVRKLFDMILKRYEKYYEVSLKKYTNDMFRRICNDSEIKEKTNYRAYTQVIMRVLEQYRNELSQKQKEEEKRKTKAVDERKKWSLNAAMKYSTWKSATSISRKTILCEMSERVMKKSGEAIVSKSIKRGEYVTNKNNIVRRYYIVATDNPSEKDFEKRIKTVREDGRDGIKFFIYPVFRITKKEKQDCKINKIFYNESTIMCMINQIYGKEDIVCDVDSYLEMLNAGRSNADN